MYTKYFGLKKAPFSIAPDPRYLYMSEQHREALAHLLYGVRNDGGFVLLTGEVGTGKTTICRSLLERLPKSCVVAFIINPRLSVPDLLASICDEFRISYPKTRMSIKLFVDRINAYLLEAHAGRRKALLIIDEAQNLDNEVLEQIRLLTNLETSERKLLQIILLGQPELRDRLASPGLKQLSQRIVARYHLGPLPKHEVALYVNHRLTVAGMREELFSPSSLDKLYGLSGGIPRVINAICDRALLGAYVQEASKVEKATLVEAAREVLGGPLSSASRHETVAGWLLAGIMTTLAVVLWTVTLYEHFQPSAPVSVQAVSKIEAEPSPRVEPLPGPEEPAPPEASREAPSGDSEKHPVQAAAPDMLERPETSSPRGPEGKDYRH